ncbi:MAG: hypothetical protein NTV51_29000 [Verrucomicrobia bacterium]|nr:hypothetical protein [Verrucomicrobiota bacterium]
MKLTAYQKRHLEALATFRKTPPTIWSVVFFRPLSWLPFLLIVVVSFGIYFLVDERWGLFLIGLTLGALLRIGSHARLAIMAWPVTAAVTDWPKVEALLQNEKSA